MAQFAGFESRREYNRYKRLFHDKCFSGRMGLVEYVKCFFKIRKILKARDKETAERVRFATISKTRINAHN
jgi:hypothetical protein